jgi:hypothetical protein
LSSTGDELRAVRGLVGGQHERQWAALAVGGEVDLPDLPALELPRRAAFTGVFADAACPLGISLGVLPALFFRAAPLT